MFRYGGPNPARTFNVKSATWLARGINPNQPKWDRRWIWKMDVPSKLQIFLWKILHHSLGVRNILFKRKIIPMKNCIFCNQHIETMDHLFITCSTSIELWDLPFTKYWLDSPMNFTAIDQALAQTRKNKIAIPKNFFLIWSIWKERNGLYLEITLITSLEFSIAPNFHTKSGVLELTSILFTV